MGDDKYFDIMDEITSKLCDNFPDIFIANDGTGRITYTGNNILEVIKEVLMDHDV